MYFQIFEFVGGSRVLGGDFGFRRAIFGVLVVGFPMRMWNIFGGFFVGLFSVQ